MKCMHPRRVPTTEPILVLVRENMYQGMPNYTASWCIMSKYYMMRPSHIPKINLANFNDLVTVYPSLASHQSIQYPFFNLLY